MASSHELCSSKDTAGIRKYMNPSIIPTRRFVGVEPARLLRNIVANRCCQGFVTTENSLSARILLVLSDFLFRLRSASHQSRAHSSRDRLSAVDANTSRRSEAISLSAAARMHSR